MTYTEGIIQMDDRLSQVIQLGGNARRNLDIGLALREICLSQ